MRSNWHWSKPWESLDSNTIINNFLKCHPLDNWPKLSLLSPMTKILRSQSLMFSLSSVSPYCTTVSQPVLTWRHDIRALLGYTPHCTISGGQSSYKTPHLDSWHIHWAVIRAFGPLSSARKLMIYWTSALKLLWYWVNIWKYRHRHW